MKKVCSLITLAIMLAALYCPALFAAADPIPTQFCVTNLTARFIAGEGDMGSILIEADVENVESGDYFNVTVYNSVEDISDPTNNSTNPQVAFKIFSSDTYVSDGKLTIEMKLAIRYLTGKCAVCVLIPGRGDGNEWVRAFLEVPLTADSGAGETKTVWAPVGFNASEWLAENCGDLFSRENLELTGWKNSDGTELGDAVIPLTGLSVTAQWYGENAYLLGDLDFDGEHSVVDALTALRIAVGLAEPDDIQAIVGDVDSSGDITVVDALSILRIAAELAPPFGYIYI
ncbi:MAG: dockerin type I repeat-containing protein [Clostridia bacterium]|nr:dockerin type I repeat-containing protein [Clostridia bacterium]